MIDITTAEAIAKLVASAQQSGGGHMIELLRPAMRRELNLLMVPRECRMPPLYRLGKQRRPLVVVIGDDDYATTGPSGFLCAAKLRQWAAYAFIHGAAATSEHYATVAMLAQIHRRVLLVETSSAATDAWGIFLHQRSDLPIGAVLCQPDVTHPATLKTGDMH